MFQVLTGEDWNAVMYETVDASSSWSFLYYFVLVGVGLYVILNLFLSVLVGGMEVVDSDLRADTKHELAESIEQQQSKVVRILRLDPANRTKKQLDIVLECLTENKFMKRHTAAERLDIVSDATVTIIDRRRGHSPLVFAQAELGQNFYVIIAGTVEIRIKADAVDSWGRQQNVEAKTVAYLSSGDSFGAASCCIPGLQPASLWPASPLACS